VVSRAQEVRIVPSRRAVWARNCEVMRDGRHLAPGGREPPPPSRWRSGVVAETARADAEGARFGDGARPAARRSGRPRQRLPKSPSLSSGCLGVGHRKVPANTNLAHTRPTLRAEASGPDDGHPGGNVGVGARSAALRETGMPGANALGPGTWGLGQRNETRESSIGRPRIPCKTRTTRWPASHGQVGGGVRSSSGPCGFAQRLRTTARGWQCRRVSPAP